VRKIDRDLIKAIKNNETQKVTSLLNQGANPNCKETYIFRGYINSYRFPLHIATRCTDNRGFGLDFFDTPKIVKSLIDFGAEVNLKDNDEFTPLRFASVEPKKESVIVLLENGADVNVLDSQGSSPLMLVSLRPNHELIKRFLEKGADINSQNNFGYTPLMYSLNFIHIEGQIETVKLLLENGADVNLKDDKGRGIKSLFENRLEQPNVQETIALLNEYL
jgi:ankyrin repeat protein